MVLRKKVKVYSVIQLVLEIFLVETPEGSSKLTLVNRSHYLKTCLDHRQVEDYLAKHSRFLEVQSKLSKSKTMSQRKVKSRMKMELLSIKMK